MRHELYTTFKPASLVDYRFTEAVAMPDGHLLLLGFKVVEDGASIFERWVIAEIDGVCSVREYGSYDRARRRLIDRAVRSIGDSHS